MLTDDELRQFKREGYLVKRGIIDQEYCARARERLWDDPPPSMVKTDPNSWVGPIRPEEESENPDNHKEGFRWKYRKVGREEWMAKGLPWDPFIQSAATQLLGKDRFHQRDCVRGIYCTLPQGNVDRQGRHMHIDDDFDPIRQQCDDNWETASVQTHGEPGDVVLWHHRMGHMASHNYTSNIRKAVLTDFSFKNIDELAKLPPGEDMWEDWAGAVRDL